MKIPNKILILLKTYYLNTLKRIILFLLSGTLISCSFPIVGNIPLLEPEHKNFEIKHLYSVSDPQFERTVGNLLGPAVFDGNKITTLLNGVEIFPAMLEAIKNAKKTITFETYIYWSGDYGKQFAEALAERAKSGIKVHVVIDWYGIDRLDQSFLGIMRQAGAEVLVFRTPKWYDPRRWKSIADVNNRTHRKILVVDGKIGFTGGVGIADEWRGNAESPEHWRDTHYKIEGPVVGELQSAFEDNWLESGGAVLHGNEYFPALPNKGNVKAQAFKGSIGEATANIELMYRLAIASAQHSIKISNAYFLPDKGIVKSLIDAANRGVKIEIIVPGTKTDQNILRLGSRAIWGDLLKAGIKIYEYQPTMYHCKVMMIDDYFVSVGSANFDNRSFRLNDEVNLNIFDAIVAKEQVKNFERDKTQSQEVTLKIWQNRSFAEKISNQFILLFRNDL